MEGKLRHLEIFCKGFEQTLCNFSGDIYLFGGRRFKPYRGSLRVKDGVYITMRCGLGGIYTMLDTMKDGKWQTGVLDNSTVIAFASLTKKETEEYEGIINGTK